MFTPLINTDPPVQYRMHVLEVETVDEGLAACSTLPRVKLFSEVQFVPLDSMTTRFRTTRLLLMYELLDMLL